MSLGSEIDDTKLGGEDEPMTDTTLAPRESIHPVDPRDHVATALRDLVAGEVLDLHGQAITVRADIPKGHKIAIRCASAGADVLK